MQCYCSIAAHTTEAQVWRGGGQAAAQAWSKDKQ